MSLATSLSSASHLTPSFKRYVVKDGGYWKGTKRLTNFTAPIVEKIFRHHGGHTSLLYRLTPRLENGSTADVLLTAIEFSQMKWADDLDYQFIIYELKDEVANAIKENSQPEDVSHVYTEMGWQVTPEGMIYCHAGGAIGKGGSVEELTTELPDSMKHYRFYEPPGGYEAKDCAQAVLGLLSGPQSVTVPLVGLVFSSVLGSLRTIVHLYGPSGTYNTEMAALIQSFFGREFNSATLPGNWNSTPKCLREQAHDTKDALLTIDDYRPGDGGRSSTEMNRIFDIVVRAAANGQGRRRHGSESKPPRGSVLSTGEDLPNGLSIRARAWLVNVTEGTIEPEWLSDMQWLSRLGFFQGCMAEFICWVAAHYRDVTFFIQNEIDEIRSGLQKQGHSRTAQMQAQLLIGIRNFLKFAVDVNAITKSEAEELESRALEALNQGAKEQAADQASADPSIQFSEALIIGFATGRVHLIGIDGGQPEDPQHWGYASDPLNPGRFTPRGTQIGWIEGSDIYLMGARVLHALNNVDVSERMLGQHLAGQKLLKTTSRTNGTGPFTIRRMIQGREFRLLHMDSGSLVSMPTP